MTLWLWIVLIAILSGVIYFWIVPKARAFFQMLLGVALVLISLNNPHGIQKAYLVRAIACVNAALRKYSRDADADKWADAQQFKAMCLNVLCATWQGIAPAEMLDEANTCLDNALLVRNKKVAPNDWADTQNMKALVLWSLSELREGSEREEIVWQAITHLDNALQVYSREVTPNDWANTQLFKALVLLALVEENQVGSEREEIVRQAIAYLDNALQVYRREVVPNDWALAQHYKGTSLLKLARLQKGVEQEKTLRQATAPLDNALLVYRREVHPLEWAMVQNDQGAILHKLSQCQQDTMREETLHKAIAYYDNASSEYHREAVLALWATTQKDKGAVLRSLAQLQQGAKRAETLRNAITCYESSLSVNTRELQPGEHFRIAQSAGMLLFEEDDWSRAVRHLTSALDALDDLFALEVTVHGRQATLTEGSDLTAHLAYALTRIGQVDTAAKVLERGRARTTGEAIARQIEQITRAEQLTPDLLVAFRKASDHLLTIVAGSSHKSAIPITMKGKHGVKATMEARHATYEEARKARVAYDVLITRIRETIPDFLRQNEILTLASDTLTPNERLAYITSSRAGAAAILIGSLTHNAGTLIAKGYWDEQLTSSQVSLLLNGPTQEDGTQQNTRGGLLAAQQGEHKAKRLRKALSMSMQQLGVSNGVLAQLAAYCRTEGVQHLVIVPCGLLGLLPLHAALVPAATTDGETEPLIDVVRVSYTPSARIWIACRRRVSSQPIEIPQALIVGNPQPQASEVPELSGASDEARTIDELISQRVHGKTSSLLEKDATLNSVLETLKADESTLTHIHFACHGIAELTEPDFSGLLLAYGARLRVYNLVVPEVIRFEQLRLVSLSACQTAIPGIELPDEMVGLSSGWLQAGAMGILASLWPISDSKAIALMTKFYELHLLDRLDPVEALWLAQRWFRQLPTWRADCQAAGAKHAAEGPEASDMVHRLAMNRSEKMPLSVVKDPSSLFEAESKAPVRGIMDLAAGVTGEGKSTGTVPNAMDRQKFWKDAPYWAAFVIYGV